MSFEGCPILENDVESTDLAHFDTYLAAIISSLRAIRRRFGTETSNSVNLVSNLSTVAHTACRVKRLLRPKIGESALKVMCVKLALRQ